ncbi:tyrosine-type recombinase/integrase [Ferrithrix thermotolerans]|nr:site-specific integrase [Ferrithrix thermotolerans]
MSEWFERVVPGLAPITVIGYQGRIRRQILPALGDLAIGEVTASHLDWLYQDLVAQGSSPASMRQTHAIIRRFFNQAMKWGWTESNPALWASPPRVTTLTVVAPTREQLIQIVERAKALHPQWEAFFVLAALTGMRRGELCALHWDDCSDGGIKVTKSLIYTSAGGTREAPTKTHQGRYVALDEFGCSVVSEQQERLRQASRSLGIGHVGNPYPFYSSPDGSVPVHPDSPSKLFRRIADNLGYRELHLHSLRHFAATQLVAAGMDIRTVSGRLGHADASTTLRVYSHVLETNNQEAAAIMGPC